MTGDRIKGTALIATCCGEAEDSLEITIEFEVLNEGYGPVPAPGEAMAVVDPGGPTECEPTQWALGDEEPQASMSLFRRLFGDDVADAAIEEAERDALERR